MSSPAQTEKSEWFWRCLQCGTPNAAHADLTNCSECGRPAPDEVVLTGHDWKVLTHRRGRWIVVATWLYAAMILSFLGLVNWVGEAWWGVSVLLFVPRWLWPVPLVLLALASALVRKPTYWILQGTVALVVLGPCMGFNIPLRQIWGRPALDKADHLRVVTYNIGAAEFNEQTFKKWIEKERVDLVLLQEVANLSPAMRVYFNRRGWFHDRSFSLVSRLPIVEDYTPLQDQSTTDQRYSAHLHRIRVRMPSGTEVGFASVHLPTIRPGFYRLFEGQPKGLTQHVEWWRMELGRVVASLREMGDYPVVIGGDFNMPTDNLSMAMLRSFYRFGFEEAGFGFGYTRPSSAPWFRIDHLLSTPHCHFRRCWVGPDFGSDHLPLVADVVIPAESRSGVITPPSSSSS